MGQGVRGGGRAAIEGKGTQRQPQRRLDRRLEEVAEAVGRGYCRLQMPLSPALGVGETVAGHTLGALGGGEEGYPPPSNASLGGGGGGGITPSCYGRQPFLYTRAPPPSTKAALPILSGQRASTAHLMIQEYVEDQPSQDALR